ncbi:MAG: flagellar basal body rod protein FlgB [Campylobacterota bacterium]|nr:flagellar basal body rod protein FlgB [Campylobacterota bacterium]
MEPSNVTELLFKQLNYRGERQKVISSNIANLDTPGFKTKELEFKNELDKSNEDYQLKLKRTHNMHMDISNSDFKDRDYKKVEVQGLEEQNDGNNVNLDTQMSQMTQNNVMFSAIQNSIKKDSAWFKSIIDSSSKN